MQKTATAESEFEFLFTSAVRGVGGKVEKIVPGAAEWLLSTSTEAGGLPELLGYWEMIGSDLAGFCVKRRGKRKAEQLARAREAFSLLVEAVQFRAAGESSRALRSMQRAWMVGWAGVN